MTPIGVCVMGSGYMSDAERRQHQAEETSRARSAQRSAESRRMPTYCMALYPSLVGNMAVPCQEPEGHDGPHRYSVVWFSAPPEPHDLGRPGGFLVDGTWYPYAVGADVQEAP